VVKAKRILENEADVADYCEAVKAALLEAIRANKRINL
jgi:outer membrane murein-binding lipoprotein Lpp